MMQGKREVHKFCGPYVPSIKIFLEIPPMDAYLFLSNHVQQLLYDEQHGIANDQSSKKDRWSLV